MIAQPAVIAVSRRRFLAVGRDVFAASVLAGIVAACGGGATAPATGPGSNPAATPAAVAAPAQSTGPTTLTVAASWTTTGWKPVWDGLIQAYKSKRSNVTISLDQSSATGQYEQKLLAAVSAGTLPDVIYTTDNFVVSFKKNKITQDMLPYAKQTNFPVNDFNKTFLDLGLVDGTVQMLPVSGDVVIFAVNKKIVQDAGVTIPWTVDPASNQWTYDDFVKVCQRLTVDGKGKRGDEAGFDKNNVSVYGAAIDPTWWAIYVPAILSNGGQFVSDDLTKSLFNSKEGVAAIEQLTKPVHDGYWAPLSFLSSAAAPFPAGRCAIVDIVRGSIPTFRNAMKDDWDVVHFYRGPAKRVTGMGTQGFALSGSTKQPNDAWAFLDFMYGEDGMKIIASQYGAVPVEKRFYEAAWWKNLPAPPANNSVFTQAFDYGTLPPRLPFYSAGPFTNAITEGFNGVEAGQMTPRQVAENASGQLQKWLDQNRNRP